MNISTLCSVAGISRQGYYKKRLQRKRIKVDSELIAQKVKIERQLMPREGCRKLHKRLCDFFKNQGIQIGRDRFLEVLREHELLLKPLPKKPKTTYSSHYLPVFSNKLKDACITGVNQAWVCDITYLKTDEDYIYLSLITDYYSRAIIGYEASEHLETQGCLRALNMAMKHLRPGECPIHHSDRGSQYCSYLYIEKLQQNGIQASMTEENHCYENAVAERLNGILKQEFALGLPFKTKKQAIKAVEQAIFLYNNRRLHLALDYKTPMSVYNKAA